MYSILFLILKSRILDSSTISMSKNYNCDFMARIFALILSLKGCDALNELINELMGRRSTQYFDKFC